MGLDAYEYLGVINVYWCRTKNLVSIFELNGNNIIDAFLVDLREKKELWPRAECPECRKLLGGNRKNLLVTIESGV